MELSMYEIICIEMTMFNYVLYFFRPAKHVEDLLKFRCI
jgi:hypothetical protein